VKIIKCDRIISGDGVSIYEDGAVVINKEGLIEDVGISDIIQNKYPYAETSIKSGCTLMPGLIDMHVHLGSFDMRLDADKIRRNLGHITLIAYKNMQDALSVGITTLRSVSEPKGLGDALRAGFHKKYIKGPRYFTCERGITVTGGHGTSSYLESQDYVIEANGPWEFRKAVRQCVKEGADWIKVLASHREHYCELTLKEMLAVTDEAHRLGKKCCVHAATKEAIEFAIEAGFDTIEHGAFLTPELAEKAAEKAIAWIPTAYIYLQAAQYLKEKIIESGEKPTKEEQIQIKYFEESTYAYRKNFKNNFNTGILVATGTDVVFPDRHITPISEEIETLCDLGLTPIEAIKCATYNAAKILDKENEVGSVKKGLYADILIIHGNPLDDIKHLKNVIEVYKEGKLLYKKDIF